MDINRVLVIGRLTGEAKVKYTNSGTCIAAFTIAVNRRKDKSGKEEADFFDVTLWGLQAEKLSPYLDKGKQVAIDGSLRQERWKGSDGKNYSKVSIVAETLQLLGGTKVQKKDVSTMQNDVDDGYDFPEDIPF